MRKAVNIDNNAFDVIRIVCAFLVFLGHFLAHYQVDAPFLTMVAYFVRGVPVFFLLSGFFVARSVERYSAKEFYVRRFVRIYPSMWVCIAINTLIIFAVYAVRPTFKEMAVYLGTQATFFQFFTGSWLRGYGVGVPNGALWTITVDIQFYLLAYLLVKWLKDKPLRYWATVICATVICADMALALVLQNCEVVIPETLFKLVMVCIVPFLYIFLFGMMVYRFRERFLPVFRRYGWAFILVYVAWMLLPESVTGILLPESVTGIFEGVRYNVVTTLLLMCAVFSVGYAGGTRVHLRFKTDYSYAFYLYHMVVINLVRHLWIDRLELGLKMFACMFAELVAIAALSYGSVELVDKRLGRALQKKAFRVMHIEGESHS